MRGLLCLWCWSPKRADAIHTWAINNCVVGYGFKAKLGCVLCPCELEMPLDLGSQKLVEYDRSLLLLLIYNVF
jgi:hypothetical protein